MGRPDIKAGSRKLLSSGYDWDPYIIFTVAPPTTEFTKTIRLINKI